MDCEMDIKQACETMQKAWPGKVGDEIKVLREFEHGEMGCRINWNRNMEETVGCLGIISKISETGGVSVDILGSHWEFPFFVLEITKPAEVMELRFFLRGKDVTDTLSETSKDKLRKVE